MHLYKDENGSIIINGEGSTINFEPVHGGISGDSHIIFENFIFQSCGLIDPIKVDLDDIGLDTSKFIIDPILTRFEILDL